MIKVTYDVEPAYKRANKYGHIELVEDWCFYINSKAYWIPKGYVCNGASIPRPLWSIVGSPFDPVNAVGAWGHDFLYLTHLVSRKIADEVGFQLWRKAGMTKRKARTMWFFVRYFAGFAWKNTKENERELVELRENIASRPNKGRFLKV